MVLRVEGIKNPLSMADFGLGYSATRIRAWHTRLFGAREYFQMLRMDLPKLVRFVGEGEYGEEMEALGIAFRGRRLVEAVLERNLSRTFRTLKEFSRGSAQKIITSYLWRWDMAGIQAVLGARSRDGGRELLSASFWPLGNLEREDLFLLLDAPDEPSVARFFEGTPFYPRVSEWLDRGDGSLEDLFLAMAREYYSEELRGIRERFPNDKVLGEILYAEAAAYNFLILAEGIVKRWSERDLVESFLPLDEGWKLLLSLALERKDLEVLRDFLRDADPFGVLHSLSPETFSPGSFGRLEIRLRHWIVSLMEQRRILSPSFPLTILSYLRLKHNEAMNIRAIATGLEAGWREEKIAQSLVIPRRKR